MDDNTSPQSSDNPFPTTIVKQIGKARNLHSNTVTLIGDTYSNGRSLTETSRICGIKRGTVERVVKDLGIMRTVGP